MKLRRRHVLRGLGGLTLTLPFLEGLQPRNAQAQEEGTQPFAIFMRQANGVAAAQDTSEIGSEPERFWPRTEGVLDLANVQGRALDEFDGMLDKLLVVDNINMEDFDYADGHARGALQCLTARPPETPGQGGDSEAGGESVDHFIGRNLNAGGRDSLFLYAGRNNGWLGGACISYRGSANRRAPLHNPLNAYQTMMGFDDATAEKIVQRQASINDMVRGQMQSLLNRPELSANDVRRLELHLQSIRDLESGLACNFTEDQQRMLEGLAAGHDSDDGDQVLAATRAHMEVAALAVACGYTRSVAIQVGNGNDGSTRFYDPDTGQQMENFHYISHRRLSHDSNGSVIPGSDLLHHKIDRQFAQTFRFLLERLQAYVMPDGQSLLDAGVAVWLNDLGNGPAHSARRIPFVLGGGAGGFLKQGQYVRAGGDGERNHAKMLSKIASAAGVRKENGDLVDDFGDPSLANGLITEAMA